jgi:hypothetical protein
MVIDELFYEVSFIYSERGKPVIATSHEKKYKIEEIKNGKKYQCFQY